MDFQISSAARTMWQEVRNEPIEGQRAVAHVIVNRRKSGRWGLTYDEVCRSEYHGVHQFSGWNRNDPNRVPASRLSDSDPALVNFAQLLVAAETELDPTGGATHYYAPLACVEPAWVVGDVPNGTPPATPCGKFGHQLFFKGVK